MSDVGRFTQLPEDSLGSDATDSLIEDDRGIPDDDRLPSPSPSLTRNDPVHRVTVVLSLRPSSVHEQEALKSLRRTKRNLPDDCLVHDDVKITISPNTCPSFFSVDRIFDVNSTSRDLYMSTVHQHVYSFVTGHSACICLYGHSGTGKSQTIMSLVSLAAEHINRVVRTMENVTLSCVELHAGQMRDMLSVTPSEPIVGSAGDSALPSSLSALPLSVVSSVPRLLKLIRRRRKNRRTPWNTLSSCGHLILLFQFILPGKQTPVQLSFVDVAAPLQRPLDVSANDEDAAMKKREFTDTNKSIHAFCEVIRQVSSNSEFVSWRMHRLTHVLQELLADNARILLIGKASISMVAESDTRNTLAFLHSVMESRKKPPKAAARLSRSENKDLGEILLAARSLANGHSVASQAPFTPSSALSMSQLARPARPIAAAPVSSTPTSQLTFSEVSSQQSQRRTAATASATPFTQWLVDTVATDPRSAAVLLMNEEALHAHPPATTPDTASPRAHSAWESVFHKEPPSTHQQRSAVRVKRGTKPPPVKINNPSRTGGIQKPAAAQMAPVVRQGEHMNGDGDEDAEEGSLQDFLVRERAEYRRLHADNAQSQSQQQEQQADGAATAVRSVPPIPPRTHPKQQQQQQPADSQTGRTFGPPIKFESDVASWVNMLSLQNSQQH